MMMGLDRSFKPEWIYRMLKLAKPGLAYKEVESDLLAIVENKGPESKKRVMTVIKRYFLETERLKSREIFKNNHLHELALTYSYDSMKPIILFVFLCKCEIARFIQKKINLLFINSEKIDTKILLDHVRSTHRDRRSTSYAVGYYLTILSYFDILNKTASSYSWKIYKLSCPEYSLKEMVLLFASIFHQKEIDLSLIYDDVVFSLYDISKIEDVLREYNSRDWVYQKRLDSAKIIIKNQNV